MAADHKKTAGPANFRRPDLINTSQANTCAAITAKAGRNTKRGDIAVATGITGSNTKADMENI